MSDWQQLRLGDVLTLQRGFDITKKQQRPGPIPVVSSSGISSTHAESRAEGPGVVIGRKGSLGTTFFLHGPFWPHDTTLWVKDFKGNDPFFCYLLLKGLRLSDLDAGSSNPTLNRNHVHMLEVATPGVVLQRRIAAVLFAFDQLIEINERRIALLEDLARSLYREWFVHFRFPGHAGMELVGAELGLIPEGWELQPLADLARSLTDGDWIETKDQGGSDYRLLQVSNVGLGAFRETGKFRYISEETFIKLRCTAIEEGDLLISRMPDPIGRAWLADQLVEPAVTAVDVAILRPLSSAVGAYLNLWLNSPPSLAMAEAAATGTTRKRISRSVLAQLKVPLPPLESLLAFETAAAPLRRHSNALRSATAHLGDIRDLLLPRLVTGRLDISDIDLDGLLPGKSE